MKQLSQLIQEKLKISNNKSHIYDFTVQDYDRLFDLLVKYDKQINKSFYNATTGEYNPPFNYLDIYDEKNLPIIDVKFLSNSSTRTIRLHGLDYNEKTRRIIVVYKLVNKEYTEPDMFTCKNGEELINLLPIDVITEIYNYLIDNTK
jgi:hypothetical protein